MRHNSDLPGQRRTGVMGRIIKTLFQFYPVLMTTVVVCIIFNAVVSSIPSIFMQQVIATVEQSWQSGDWDAVGGHILGMVALLVTFYVLSLVASVAYTQMMAVITQGTLKKLREKMFNGMQDLPIKYFDTNNHGDIMSHYTNDIDTLRQMVSQSIPQLMVSGIIVLSVLCIMLYYSLWLTLVVLAGRGGHAHRHQEGGRPVRQVLLPPAGRLRQGGGLCGGDDERPEGCQGFLPRGGDRGGL